MKIYYNYDSTTPTAVALGNFDGVHLGHTKLINTLTSFNMPSLVYTFYSHPLNFIKGEGSVEVIQTHKEKESLFENLGVDILFYESFERVRNMTPEEFVKNVLIDTLHAKEVICGFNYRFGKNNTGDVTVLKDILSEYGVNLTVIDEVTIDGESISSSAIRSALINGEIEKANKMLGRNYFVMSKVLHGKALGRTLGFPTVNLNFEENRVVLSYGVYFALFSYENERHPAIVNVGIRPTVDNALKPTIEAHIVDFKGDLYEKEVKIEFLTKTRSEQKFESLERLKKQVHKDILDCKKYFQGR